MIGEDVEVRAEHRSFRKNVRKTNGKLKYRFVLRQRRGSANGLSNS